MRKDKKYLRRAGALLVSASLLLAGCKGGAQEETTAVTEAPPTEGKEALLEFQASVSNQGNPLTAELRYYQTGEDEFCYELTIGEACVTIPMREDFWENSVSEGLQVYDVNGDGWEDVLVDLGIYGHLRLTDCLVYTEDRGYVQVPGFCELSNAHWSEAAGAVIEEWHDSAEYAINHYQINGTELYLLESLNWEYINGGAPLYTERKDIGGEMTVVREAVPESEIDLDYWYGSGSEYGDHVRAGQ